MCYIDFVFQALLCARDRGIRSSSCPQGDEGSQMSKWAFPGQCGNSYDSTQNKELQSYLERILNPTLGGNGPVLSYSALHNEVNKVNSFLNMTFKMKPEK